MLKKSALIRKGRNIGALAGGILYVLFGLIPALYLSSRATLILIPKLIGVSIQSEILVRILAITGTVLGLFLTGTVFIVLGAVTGTLISHGIYSAVQFWRSLRGEAAEERPILVINKRTPVLSEDIRREIERELEFLKPILKDLHSMVVIGSSAYGINEDNSDIDIVIIARKDGFERVRDMVFEHEIDLSLKGDRKKKEFIVLGPDYTEEMFRLSSPFSFSIRYGVILKDDGYLKSLFKKYHPALPERSYYFKAFYEYVAIQYYGSLTNLEKNIKGKGCSRECCSRKADCSGLDNVEMFLKVILRMLYLTLPAKGYIPLTKKDLIQYVRNLYGREWALGIEEIVNLSRTSPQTLYYDQYIKLKPIATGLFRETIDILGKKAEVIKVLRDAASMVRGQYSKIEDRFFKECVI
ncbi:MAG: hypothetical protein GXO97_06565 [Nitrospirae bacterium]|nr:hypothetical protein [Nitrospirota bacterium]